MRPKIIEGIDYYREPGGRMVFTEEYHLKRGYCCNGRCRHCPYKTTFSQVKPSIIIDNTLKVKGKNMQVATENSWKIDEESIKYDKTIPVNFKFSKDEMVKINSGFIPSCMEDKWFIYKKSDRLFFHRSWTGLYFMSADFKESDDGFIMYAINLPKDNSQSVIEELAFNLIKNLILFRPKDNLNCNECPENDNCPGFNYCPFLLIKKV